MKKYAKFYIYTILFFVAALWFVLVQGKGLEYSKFASSSIPQAASSVEQAHFFSNIEANSSHPLAILIIQIFSIMITARVFGFCMTKIGQPSVVGEILAGILLGPSLLGYFFPEFSSFLFPIESLRRLHVLSQIGLVLFMFVIGMELDIGVLKKKARDAVLVSHASIVFPYFLGVVLAYYLYPSYAPSHIPFSAFALFMGIAMSITAFPVLARIIQERNLTQTSLGTLVITCAAADDVTAWCLLALVVAIVSAGGMISAVGSITMSVVYVLAMWFIVRPILRRMAVKYDTPESINNSVVAFVFGILLLSSYVTEVIGIHALFGAFGAGVVMPQQKEFKRIVAEKIEDISLVLFLPLFFVFTGLRTQVGLLSSADLWNVCFLIIGVAVFGKFFGSAVAARFVGQNWKDSLLIGVLMNTRGLMELVVLNIGYDLGVLSAEIFTMMVLMALVTTFMTGPAMNVIEFIFRPKAQGLGVLATEGFRTLIAFGSPRSGARLLEVANYLNLKDASPASITAVHFSSSADISFAEAEHYDREAFLPINYTAGQLGLSVKKIFRVTDNIEREMFTTVDEIGCNILLLGESRKLFMEDQMGGKVKALMREAECAVGVFIDRGFTVTHRASMILAVEEDRFLLDYAVRFLQGNSENRLTVIAHESIFKTKADLEKAMPDPNSNVELVRDFPANAAAPSDIAIVSLGFWQSYKGKKQTWIAQMPSLLIVRR